jgi:SAM-dependent methyltransferase
MGDWESIFKSKGRFILDPEKDVINFLEYANENNVKSILDLGCGSGRHTVLLAKLGFNVYAMDISGTGLKITKDWLQDHNLKAKLTKASCYDRFPYDNDFFDAVISTQVIHHNYHEKILFTISEIIRVLKPDGLLLLTAPFRKNQSQLFKYKKMIKTKDIALHTYIPLEGEEKGLPHFLYTKALLKEDFRMFNILDIHKTGGHYCLIGRLKKI